MCLPEMLLLYALLIVVFVGTLASFQLTSEIDTDSHNIRREVTTRAAPSTSLPRVVETVASVATVAPYVPVQVVPAVPDTVIEKVPVYISEPLSDIDSDLVVLVMSGRDNTDRRNAIRDTWARGHKNTYFVVGTHCKYKISQRQPWTCVPKNKNFKVDSKYIEREKAFTNELRSKKDILVVGAVDVYRNMASKLKEAYMHVLKHSSAKHVLKIDDDSFVRVNSLAHWLRKSQEKYEIIAGGFQRGNPNKSGKWKETKYKKPYPPFPSGAGHVLTRACLQYMHDYPQTWVSYQGEDTSVGIWIENIKHKIKVKMTKSNHFTTHSGDCHNKKKMVVGHNISPKKLRQCYATMDELPGIATPVKIPTARSMLTKCERTDGKNICVDAKGSKFEISPREDVKNLHEVQNRLLRMLDVLDHLAQKHNIVYWICAGTLIGAMRHGGFIPFDADIDVSMPAKDYKKFQEIAQAELPSDLFLQDWDSDEHFVKALKYWGRPINHKYAKLRDLNTDYTEYSARHKRMHNGLQIDIFVPDEKYRGKCMCCAKHPDNSIFPLRRVQFENGVEVNVPLHSRELLVPYYAEWQTIPPKISSRNAHQGVVAFKAPDWVKKLYPHLYVQSRCTSNPSGKFWKVFKSLVTILNKMDAPWNMCSGTALHWYRDCHLGNSDIDICIDFDWFRKNPKTLRKQFLDSGWTEKKPFGDINKFGYEERYLKLGVKVDLFSMAKIKDDLFVGGYTIGKNTYPCYRHMRSVKTDMWGGLSVRYPFPIEPYLEKKYGSDWNIKKLSNFDPFDQSKGTHNCVKEKMPKREKKGQCEIFDTFQPPSFHFKGPHDQQIAFTAGIKSSCDLLHDHCNEIQGGNAKAPDHWLVDFIELSMSNCDDCLSFDFGSNLGLLTLSLMSTGSSVVSVEPQIDLCCASTVSAKSLNNKNMAYCGGVKTSSDNTKSLRLCSDSPGFRDGWIPKGKELSTLYKSIGIPDCYDAPLISLSKIMHQGESKFGKNIATVKIDTDSVDCDLLEELLISGRDFTSVTFETWAHDACYTRETFISLISQLQRNNYDVYHTPAQPNAYNEKYKHKKNDLITGIVKLRRSTIWKISAVDSMTSLQHRSLHSLKNTYQMMATKIKLLPHFFVIWENQVNNVDLGNVDYVSMIKNCVKSLKHHNYEVTLMSNSLNWGVKFDTYKLAKGTPLDSSIFDLIQTSKHPMVHLADVLRILLLWKYGGSYVDADSVLKKDIHLQQATRNKKKLLMRSPNNHKNCRGAVKCISFKNEKFYISNGLLHNFPARSVFLGRLLSQMKNTYNPRSWSSIGPHMLTRVWDTLSESQKAEYELVEWQHIWGHGECTTCDFEEGDFQKK